MKAAPVSSDELTRPVGLAIVEAIAKALGGSAGVSSGR